jgi:hypothetical protein
MVPSKREQLDRLLKLYRHGRISEDLLLDQLEDVAEERDGSDGGVASASNGSPAMPADATADTTAALIEILDRFRAAEDSGSQTLLRWARLTTDASLVGGLRVVASREAAHASLLEERIRELGKAPTAEVPAWLAGFNEALVSRDATDLERLAALVAQFEDFARAMEPLEEAITLAADDELTREVLRAIRDDEIATIEWFRSAYAARNEA